MSKYLGFGYIVVAVGYSLDRAIGREGQKGATLGVKKRALWAALELSCEKASSFLKKFTALEVSRQKIYNMAQEKGRRIEAWEEGRKEVFGQRKALKNRWGKRPKILYFKGNPTGMNDCSSKEWMDCKVGPGFSQRAQVSKIRYRLRDKKTYA